MSSPGRGGSAGRIYALAQLGAHLAFVPLFALLLPRRAVALAPHEATALLSWLLVTGGVIASVAHILAGGFSDRWFARHGDRRGPIAAGLLATFCALAVMGWARTPGGLIGAIVAFQAALNLMFSPLSALLTDYFPNHVKGRVAALVNIALPLANLGTTAIAVIFPEDAAWAFAAVAALIVVLVAPLLVLWPFHNAPADSGADDAVPAAATAKTPLSDFLLAWFSRLLVQAGAAFVINYFYLYLRHRTGGALGDDAVSAIVGRLALITTFVVLGATLLAGRWSDLRRRRRAPMAISAGVSAVALLIIALGGNFTLILAGYVLFHAGLTGFLAIDAALIAEILTAHTRRGEFLGYMNLTNTMPGMVVSAAALASLNTRPDIPWSFCFALGAALAAVASLLVLRIRSVD